MNEKQFGWNYFENEVVIRDKQDKKRMIVIVLSNFMDIPHNRKSFDELVAWLNEQGSIIRRDELSMKTMMSNMEKLEKENEQLEEHIKLLQKTIERMTEKMNEIYQLSASERSV